MTRGPASANRKNNKGCSASTDIHGGKKERCEHFSGLKCSIKLSRFAHRNIIVYNPPGPSPGTHSVFLKRDNKQYKRNRSRRVFFAPCGQDNTPSITFPLPPPPFTVHPNSTPQEVRQYLNSAPASAPSASCSPTSTTPTIIRPQQKCMSAKRKSNSQKKSSPSSKRWKDLLFRRLRARDNRILHYLQSRPPPPTVGHPYPTLHTDALPSADNAAAATDDDMDIPEAYAHLFDQLGSRCNQDQVDDSEGGEVQAEHSITAVDKSPPGTPLSQELPKDEASCYTRHGPTITRNATVGSSSLDFFGSYLQDYQQSDYKNNLFDESVLNNFQA